MSMYRVLDRTIGDTDEGLHDLLAAAYNAKSRPVCMCRNPPVEMYIAKVNGRCLVKRMPNTGGDHSPACDSYEPPAELSGLGQVMGSAIQENTDEGITTIKLNFSLTKVAGRAAPVASGAEKDSVKTDGTKLTLRGTLHYLWEEAGFNRWSPAMAGKRSWYTVRKFLSHSAENKIAKGANIADILYIPETFSAEKKDEITQRRLAQFRKAAAPSKDTRYLMLAIAEVKEIGPSRNGFKVIFKHVGEPFMMNEDLHKRMVKRFNVELELWGAVETSHLMTVCTFSVSSTGIPTIEEMALMVVTENWIPFESRYDKLLLDALTANNRRFVKGLRYNLASTKPLACVVLSDTSPSPTAMYIQPMNATEEFTNELKSLMQESKLIPWHWNAGDDDMPALPAPMTRR